MELQNVGYFLALFAEENFDREQALARLEAALLELP